MNDRQDRKAFFRELGKYSALGLEMALSVVIGMGIGYYLDRWLGTGPWLMIVWISLGFAAGVRSLYRAAVRSGKDLDRDEEQRRKPGGPCRPGPVVAAVADEPDPPLRGTDSRGNRGRGRGGSGERLDASRSGVRRRHRVRELLPYKEDPGEGVR